MIKFFKKTLLISFLFLNHQTIYSQSSWFWQQPYPAGNEFYCVKMVSNEIIYAGGVLGTVLRSTNAGYNWTVLNTGTKVTFRCSDFIDANTGVIAGDSGVLIRTTNGGTSWTKQIIATGEFNVLRGVDFVNNTLGYMACYNGLLYKTTNAGVNWTTLPTGTTNSLLAVDFLDSLNGMVTGIALALRTTNGGASWTSETFGLGSFDFLSSVVLSDSLNAVVLREEENIYKTTNGGLNWTSHELYLSQVWGCCDIARDISFINVNTGFLVSSFGTILKTTNGGVNWSVNSEFTKFEDIIFILWGVDALDSNNITAAGIGGNILRSTNGGSNFNIQNGFKKRLNGNYFTSASTGYNVGDSGKIFKTTDEGSSWNQQNSPTTKRLNTVLFLNENTGYVCGDTGVILKTTNAGMNWNQQESGLEREFRDIYFTSLDTGYISGGYENIGIAVIIKTSNGGLNWYQQFNATSFGIINSITFLNSNTGFFCTELGIYKTTNSGDNWSSVATGISGRGNEVYFLDSLNGLVTGGTTSFYRTTNGGNNWFTVSLPGMNHALSSIHSVNNLIVYCAGRDGAVIKSTNGGNNWISLPIITNNWFHSVYFVNANTGYVVGDHGTIVKTTNGGITFISKNNSVLPEDYFLSQNYPNPFNPLTKINYKVYRSSYVKIILYDISGKEILKLVSSHHAPGEYEVLLDGSGISSGVYLYSMFVDDRLVETKKSLLIK